jgi:hypothetical protein
MSLDVARDTRFAQTKHTILKFYDGCLGASEPILMGESSAPGGI